MRFETFVVGFKRVRSMYILAAHGGHRTPSTDPTATLDLKCVLASGDNLKTARVEQLNLVGGVNLGFGHIVPSEIKVPDMLVDLGKNGLAVVQSDNATGPYVDLGGEVAFGAQPLQRRQLCLE